LTSWTVQRTPSCLLRKKSNQYSQPRVSTQTHELQLKHNHSFSLATNDTLISLLPRSLVCKHVSTSSHLWVSNPQTQAISLAQKSNLTQPSTAHDFHNPPAQLRRISHKPLLHDKNISSSRKLLIARHYISPDYLFPLQEWISDHSSNHPNTPGTPTYALHYARTRSSYQAISEFPTRDLINLRLREREQLARSYRRRFGSYCIHTRGKEYISDWDCGGFICA